MSSTRCCWECKHFWYSQAEEDWSDLTPGSNFEIHCDQSIWSFDAFRTTQEEFGKILSTAKTCDKFEERST